jgi:hypothetical protein
MTCTRSEQGEAVDFAPQVLGSGVLVSTRATFPELPLILIVPDASPSLSTVPPVPFASLTR